MWRPLRGLTWRNLASEALAGVTLLAIAVPLNIGYAQIAGLPPTAGLYALVLPSIIYALTVTSRQVVASPDAAAAALVASSIGGLAVAGSASYVSMALAQAIICGVLFVLAAVLKLGFLANFLSKPILIGFVGGLALDILISQMAKMIGVRIDSGGEFVDKLFGLFSGLPTSNGWALLISGASVALLLLGRRIARAVPWALIVLIASTVVVAASGLSKQGVAVLGPVEAGPPELTWPVLDWGTWLALIPSGIALTIVAMAEGLLIARSYGDKNAYAVYPNRDLLAFGLGNIAAGASGGFSIGSSTSRTAAMDQAGSRTQLPSLVTAIGTLTLLLFGVTLLEQIPSPAIGAIVAVAVVPLLGVREVRTLWGQDRFEFLISISCFVVTLMVGAIAGIVVAFVLALVNLAKRASAPAIDILSADDNPDSSLLTAAPHGQATAPGVLVIRLAAPLFFANGAVFSEAVKRAVTISPDVRHVVLDLEALTDVDVTGAESLIALIRWLDDRNIVLSYSRPRPELLHRLRTFGIATDRIYLTNRAALNALMRPHE